MNNKYLEQTIMEEKQEIDYDVRETLKDAFVAITRIVFENEILEKTRETMNNFEFEEGEDVAAEDYKYLRNAKARNIDNRFKMFKIEVEMNADSRLQSFSKKFRQTINEENKEEYLTKMEELNRAMVILEDYANNAIENAVAILDGATRAAIMKMQIIE